MSEIPMYPDEIPADEDRCFCGAEWNDLAEECVEGHSFGEADKFRVRAEKAEAHAAGLAKLASHLQAELDQQRGRVARLEEALTLILAVSDDDPILRTAREAMK